MNLLEREQLLMPKPKVFLPIEEAKKIWAFVKSVPGEINGLGLVERKGNDFWIREVFILRQKADIGHATIDPLAFNQYVGECEDPGQIRFQWHSHGDISAKFFSGTDMQETIAKWTGEYLISMVVNKNGEYRCRLDIFEPIYLGFEITLLIVVPVEQGVVDFCQKEIKGKVNVNPGFVEKVMRRIDRRKKRRNWDQSTEPMSSHLGNLEFQEGNGDE